MKKWFTKRLLPKLERRMIMKKLNDILESIVLTIQDEEVQYPEEYALSELRNYIKDEEIIKEIKDEILESV